MSVSEATALEAGDRASHLHEADAALVLRSNAQTKASALQRLKVITGPVISGALNVGEHTKTFMYSVYPAKRHGCFAGLGSADAA